MKAGLLPNNKMQRSGAENAVGSILSINLKQAWVKEDAYNAHTK